MKNWHEKIITFGPPVILFWLAFVLCRVQYNALWLILLFTGLLYLPGFSLLKIFKLKNENLVNQIIQIIALGFIWNLFLALIAMVSAINIDELALIYLSSTNILWIIAFLLNFKSNQSVEIKPEKAIAIKKNWLYLLPLVLTLVIIILVTLSKGAIFEQEAFFHLSIMRKAYDGASLSPLNLSFVRTEGAHIVYGLPIWHIFLSEFAKIANTNIFNIWNILPFPLVIISTIVYFSLLKNIFKNQQLAIISTTLLFISYTVFDNSYMLTRIAIPNSLSLLIFFPLILNQIIDFIFSDNFHLNKLIISIILLFLLFLIHALQPLYIILVLTIAFGLVLLLRIFDYSWIVILKRFFIFLLILFMMAITIFLIKFFLNPALTLNNHEIFNTNYDTFNHLNFYTKISFLLFPLLYFALKNKKIIIIMAVFLILPILYSPFSFQLRAYFLKFLGNIFFYRLDAFSIWDFAVWGVIIFLLIGYVSSLIAKLKKSHQKVINYSAFVFIFALPFIAVKSKIFFSIYKSTVANAGLSSWLNHNYYLLLFMLIGIILLVILWQKQDRLQIFKYNIFNVYFGALVSMFISLVLLSPTINFSYNTIINTDYKVILLDPEINQNKINLGLIGNETALNFIKTNIKPKSVILADGFANDIIPLLTDNFSAAYPRSVKEKLSRKVYSDILNEEKKEIIDQLKVDYIFFSPAIVKKAETMNNSPQYKLIFDGESKIYEVIKKTP